MSTEPVAVGRPYAAATNAELERLAASDDPAVAYQADAEALRRAEAVLGFPAISGAHARPRRWPTA